MTPGDGRSVFGWPLKYTQGDLTKVQLGHYHHFRETKSFTSTPGPPVWAAVSLQPVRTPALLGNLSIALLITVVGCGYVTSGGNTEGASVYASTLHLFCVVLFLAAFTALWQTSTVGTLAIFYRPLAVAVSLALPVNLLRVMRLQGMSRGFVAERTVLDVESRDTSRAIDRSSIRLGWIFVLLFVACSAHCFAISRVFSPPLLPWLVRGYDHELWLDTVSWAGALAILQWSVSLLRRPRLKITLMVKLCRSCFPAFACVAYGWFSQAAFKFFGSWELAQNPAFDVGTSCFLAILWSATIHLTGHVLSPWIVYNSHLCRCETGALSRDHWRD
jgi:hypothetical protein